MNFSIRRKLDMAGRVRDFCRTHPDQNNPGYTAAVERLEERLDRAEALAQQEVSGRQAVSGAVINKEQLRLEIHKVIALLAGLAQPAAREERELAVGIIRPDVNGSHQAFLTRSRVAAATASSHQELLVKYGMPENFLAELDAKLNEYEPGGCAQPVPLPERPRVAGGMEEREGCRLALSGEGRNAGGKDG